MLFRSKEEATQMILQGTQLEIEYARDTMPRGVLGMNAAMMEDYLKFIANRRLSQIGLKEEYPGTTNPFPWTLSRIFMAAASNTVAPSTASVREPAARLPCYLRRTLRATGSRSCNGCRCVSM